MRFIISGILGLAITLAMLVVGLQFFDGRVTPASLRKGIEVAPLPSHQRVDVAEWIRDTRGDLPDPDAGPEVRVPPPPPFEIGARDVSGFVQITFTVLPDGRATDVQVFGAAPSGYYEDQAVAAVQARRWDPGVDADGRPAPRRATEVIEFSVPADAPRRTGTDG